MRTFMPLAIIAMWSLFAFLYSQNLIDSFLLTGLAVCHFACLLVFVNFVHIFTYSYAICVVVLHAMLLLLHGSSASPALILVCLAFILYGLRLFGFVLIRYRQSSYGENVRSMRESHMKIPVFVKLMIFVIVSWLMLFHSMSAYYIAQNVVSVNGLTWLGVGIMYIGLGVETLADMQKQRHKRENGNTFCHSGLYSRLRHPNYFGEALFYAGLYLAGASVFSQWYQFVAAAIGPCWNIVLMYATASSSDKKQLIKYADAPGFQDYLHRSKSLIPGVL